MDFRVGDDVKLTIPLVLRVDEYGVTHVFSLSEVDTDDSSVETFVFTLPPFHRIHKIIMDATISVNGSPPVVSEQLLNELIVEQLLVDWSLTDNEGQKLPVTWDTIKVLPYQLITKLAKEFRRIVFTVE